MGSRLNILHLSETPHLPREIVQPEAATLLPHGMQFHPHHAPLDPGPTAVSPPHAMGLDSVELVMAVEKQFDMTIEQLYREDADFVRDLGMD